MIEISETNWDFAEKLRVTEENLAGNVYDHCKRDPSVSYLNLYSTSGTGNRGLFLKMFFIAIFAV